MLYFNYYCIIYTIQLNIATRSYKSITEESMNIFFPEPAKPKPAKTRAFYRVKNNVVGMHNILRTDVVFKRIS